MELKQIMESLHPLEVKVIPSLKKYTKFEYLVKDSGLKDVEVMRALQWLENKGALKIIKVEKELVELDVNGKTYIKTGLPEKRLLTELSKGDKSLAQLESLEKQETGIAIGALKSKAAILIDKGKLSITPQGTSLLEKESLEELFLKKSFPLDTSELKEEEVFALNNLKKRKQILKVEKRKLITVELTELGNQLVKQDIKAEDLIDRLTPKLIKSGKWKDKKFRRYDVSINVPQIDGGKRHPYVEFIEETKRKLEKMGFIEMTGPIIESEFFNFDALYQPQNHPARTWSATYRIKKPKCGDLPNEAIVQAVKDVHETGGSTGSTGWKYHWNPEIASQLMPRAHDTAISPRYLAKGVKIPGKYFSIVRCFRPDVIDATHGVEFNQLGGFVVGKELAFKHLLGLLKDFAIQMTGAKEVKFFPDYFPFTEPSVQISVKHPEFGWMELAGAGIFRPELTEPLGIKEPVIAWGFGIDRLAMLKLGIKDIRNLFSHNLDFLRKTKKVYE